MLAYQTDNDSPRTEFGPINFFLVKNEHKCYWKTSKSLRAASFNAGISCPSHSLTLGANEASGSQTAGKFQCLWDGAWIFSASLEADLAPPSF